ncbi:MAG: ornithine cyclodeaminase family protein [Aminobacteriaceae bacterium]
MFFMSADDILASFSFSGVIGSVEETMVDMESSPDSMVAPPRNSFSFGDNSLITMPCLSQREWGLKILTLFPDNPIRKKPFINGLFLLFDGSDGRLSALLDGRTLTALRTGGVGGLAVRTLSKEGVKRLGVVGAGDQGFWQARFACSVRNFSKVVFFDTEISKAKTCARRIQELLPDLNISIAEDATALLKSSDVVITATTNTSTPLFRCSPSSFKGKTLIGIGSYRPDMREYPDTVFQGVSEVFVDSKHALDETGDLIHPLRSGIIKRERIKTLGSLLLSPDKRVDHLSGSLFKSVGFAAFDLYVARHILKRALKLGRGTELGGIKTIF